MFTNNNILDLNTDITNEYLEHLSYDDITAIFRTSKTAQIKILESFETKLKLVNYADAKRVLILAVKHIPEALEALLPKIWKQYPQLFNDVLESREITIEISKQKFTAIWNLQLPHLNALYGRKTIDAFLLDKAKEEVGNSEEGLVSYLNQPIRWKSGELSGTNGPTALLTALLLNNTNYDYLNNYSNYKNLVLDDTYDSPFSEINPFNIAIDVYKKTQNDSLLKLIIKKSINEKETRTKIISCVKNIIENTFDEDRIILNAYFNILRSLHEFIPHEYIDPLFYLSIEKQNVEALNLICPHIRNTNHLKIESKSIQHQIISKARKDNNYLPMVRVLLCHDGFNYNDVDKLIKKSTHFFSSENRNIELIRHYFKIAYYFKTMIAILSGDLEYSHLCPFDSLRIAGELDLKNKCNFFNEMILSFLTNKNGEKINIHFSSDKNLSEKLLNMIAEFLDKETVQYFHSETLETIADSVLDLSDRKSNRDIHDLAIFFYRMTSMRADKNSACFHRVDQKLQDFGVRKYLEFNKRP